MIKLVLDSDLRLCIRQGPLEHAATAQCSQTGGQLVGQHQRQRHGLGRFIRSLKLHNRFRITIFKLVPPAVFDLDRAYSKKLEIAEK